MSRLSEAARVTAAAGAVWRNCAACDVLFPAAPDQRVCTDCGAGAGAVGGAGPVQPVLFCRPDGSGAGVVQPPLFPSPAGGRVSGVAR